MPFVGTGNDAARSYLPESEDPSPLDMWLYPLDTRFDADSPFSSIVSAWNARRTGDGPPEWDAFDFADFRGWHSHLKVSVFPDDEPDPLFRIMGESWRLVALGNLAGVRFSEMRPKLFRRQLRDHFKAIRDGALIGRTRGKIAGISRDFISIEIMELPVARDGKRVGGLLHCLHFHE